MNYTITDKTGGTFWTFRNGIVTQKRPGHDGVDVGNFATVGELVDWIYVRVTNATFPMGYPLPKLEIEIVTGD